MSNDLHRILSDVADQAAAASPALPVEAIIFQRRRRRAVTRTVGAGGIAAGLTAVAVVAGVLNGPDDTPVPPAVPTPSISPSPAPTIPPVAPPVCGGGTEGIPVELTLIAEPEQTLGAATTGTVEAAAGVLTGRSVSLALLADGVVIAQTEGSEAADPASTVEGAAGADPAAISGVLEACGGALAAGEYQLVAVADGAAGAVVSAPMDVTLREVEEEVVVDPSAGWEPLPEANGFNLGEEPFTSDDPGATQPLPDGRYWAAVENIDPTTRSFDATIEIMRLGDDAIEWAKVNEPYSVDEDGDMTPAVNYSPTAFGTQRMTVPVDARIYSWCQASPEGYMRESPIEYLVSPTPGCDYSTGSGEGFDGGYWLDVRGGEIRQMVSIFAL